MAQFEFTVPTGFLMKLGQLSEVDKYAPKMIDESIPILVNEVKKSLEHHKRTGLMVKSIKATKAGCKDGVYFAVVRPTGQSSKTMSTSGKVYMRPKPVRNMEIVAHIEYGTSTQDGTPFLTKAYKDAEPAVLKKMEEVFNREALANDKAEGALPW